MRWPPARRGEGARCRRYYRLGDDKARRPVEHGSRSRNTRRYRARRHRGKRSSQYLATMPASSWCRRRDRDSRTSANRIHVGQRESLCRAGADRAKGLATTMALEYLLLLKWRVDLRRGRRRARATVSRSTLLSSRIGPGRLPSSHHPAPCPDRRSRGQRARRGRRSRVVRPAIATPAASPGGADQQSGRCGTGWRGLNAPWMRFRCATRLSGLPALLPWREVGAERWWSPPLEDARRDELVPHGRKFSMSVMAERPRGAWGWGCGGRPTWVASGCGEIDEAGAWWAELEGEIVELASAAAPSSRQSTMVTAGLSYRDIRAS